MPRKGETSMKRSTVLALFAATFISIGGACAHAQVAREFLFKVPFDFNVGNQTLPMGTYRVTRESGDILLIQARGVGSALVLSSAPSSDNGQGDGGELVFNRYGNQYFLHEVLCRYPTMHAEIQTSRLEKQAQIQNATLRNTTQSVAVLQTPNQR